jgi:hypothetical protein
LNGSDDSDEGDELLDSLAKKKTRTWKQPTTITQKPTNENRKVGRSSQQKPIHIVDMTFR